MCFIFISQVLQKCISHKYNFTACKTFGAHETTSGRLWLTPGFLNFEGFIVQNDRFFFVF